MDTDDGILQYHTPPLTSSIDASLHIITSTTTYALAIQKEFFIACTRQASMWKPLQMNAKIMLAKMVTPGERTKEEVEVIETYVQGMFYGCAM